jgi:serine phosphatase RsbU (regulator of sigma subunit)
VFQAVLAAAIDNPALPTRFLEDAHQTIKRLNRRAPSPPRLMGHSADEFSESGFKQEELPWRKANRCKSGARTIAGRGNVSETTDAAAQ